MKFRTSVAAVITFVPILVCFPAPGRADTGGPTGQWYLNANHSVLSVNISSPSPGIYTGTIISEGGGTEVLDNISWDSSSRTLQFRRQGAGFWEWYYGSVVEGILVGRFSHSSTSPQKPEQLTSFTSHVTGWNSSYLDTAIVPRVWEVLLDNNDRARLRIDQGSNGFVGRLKVYSTVSAGAAGEELEYDLDAIEWDGTNLTFTQHLDQTTSRTFQALVSGRGISGSYSPGAGSFSGTRAEVLTHGLVPKTADALRQWIDRTRSQLRHLLMADNPQPLSRNVTVLASDLPPTPSTLLEPNRDDNPAAWPQEYTMSELRFDYTLPNPYGGAPIARSSHAYLATPTMPPPAGGKYPALLAVNGHGGSAWIMMNPDEWLYWYGDSYARRGYAVLAVDISHRPLEDRASLYDDYNEGDDPDHGNGLHPAIKAAGFDSDWEEDGERSWDATRALDYLFSLPDVDPNRIVISGISMGGEVTSITGGLDPRFSAIIPAGFSPDLGVMLYNGNHPCWQWQHGDVREYVDASDYFALAAPRPLLIETGKQDFCYSQHNPPFSSDKQVARRSLAAYNADATRFNLYLHYDEHRYHVGDVNPTSPTERGVRVPDQLTPAESWDLTWQTAASTHTLQPTLFDWISPAGGSAPILSVTTLDFGSQSVGTTSAPRQVTVTNTASSALTFTGIQSSSDWAIIEPDGCQPLLGAGASCTLEITFAPAAMGSRTGTLTFTDNASNSPQTVSLTGTGLAAIASLTSTGLTFPNLPVGTASGAQTVTLSNTGNQTLSITGISLSGSDSSDFGVSQDCGNSIAAGASCTVSVTFTPTDMGNRTGILTLTSNALNGPQTLSLSGTGLAAVVSFSPAKVTLPPQLVGTTGPPQNVKMTNNGDAALRISSVQTSAGFKTVSECASSLAAGASCAIGVSLDPSVVGTRNGTLTITDNAPGSPHTVALSGTGMDFSLSAPASSATIPAGQTATYSVNVAPQGGLNQSVNLTCSGEPSLSTCTVTPNAVTLNGTTPATVIVAVSTTAESLAPPFERVSPPHITGFGQTSWVYLFLVLASGAVLAGVKKRRAAYPLGLCLLTVMLWSACGGGGVVRTPGTPSGSYALEVTATVTSDTASSKLVHDLKLTLTVN